MIHIRWVRAVLDTPTTTADRSQRFWAAVTRSRVSQPRGEHDELATLVPERGDAWIALQQVVESGGVHLDLEVDIPLPEAAAQATRLGATQISRRADVVVMRSPGGMVFCLTSWVRAGSASHQVRDGQPDLLDQVCLDISPQNHSREVDFWETITGWPKRPGSLPEFVSLTRPDGIPVRLLLQRLDEPTATVRAHLDLATTDRAASRRAHRAAGAEVVSEHDFWTVMRDPAGRVYCLTDRRP